MFNRVTSYLNRRSGVAQKAPYPPSHTDNGHEQSQNIFEASQPFTLNDSTAHFESVEQPSDLSCMSVQTMPRHPKSGKIVKKTALLPSTSISTSVNMDLLQDEGQAASQMTSTDIGEGAIHASILPTTITTTSSVDSGIAVATFTPASAICDPVAALPGARGLDDIVSRIPKSATPDALARPSSTAVGTPGLTNNLLLHENHALPVVPAPAATITVPPHSKKFHVRGGHGRFIRANAAATCENAQSDAAEHLPPTHSSRKRGPPAQGISSRSSKHQKRNTSIRENLVQTGELRDEDVSMSDDGETNYGGMTVEEFVRGCPKTAAAARESQDGDEDEQMPQRPCSNEAPRSPVSIEEVFAVPLSTGRGRNKATRQQPTISSRSSPGLTTSSRRSRRLNKNSDQNTATMIAAPEAEHLTLAAPNIGAPRGAVAHDSDENGKHDASKKKVKRNATMKSTKSSVDSSKPFGGPHPNPEGLRPDKMWYPDYIIAQMKVDGRFHVGVAWERGPNGEPYLPTWEPQTAFQSNIVMRRYYYQEAKKEKNDRSYKRDIPEVKSEEDTSWPKLVLRE